MFPIQFITKYKIGFIYAFLIVLQSTGVAQDFQNSIRRSTILDGNEIRTLASNHGTLGYPGMLPTFEWPNGTGQYYAWEMGFYVGVSIQPQNTDRLHFINEGLLVGGMLQTCWVPEGQFNSGWEPQTGYAVADSGGSIARSDDEATWPDTWNTWPGHFHEDEILADLETYYVVDDRYNCMHTDTYLPDPEDEQRGGVGIEVSVRTFQWDDQPVEDVLFTIYELKNASNLTMDSVIFAFRGDPSMGGIGDYSDDMISAITADGYDHVLGEHRPDVSNMVYAWDANGVGDPFYNGRDPGYMGLHIMDGTLDLLGLRIINFNPSASSEDEYWDWFTDQNWSADDFLNNRDNIFIFSLESITLEPGETFEIPLAIVFGETRDELMHNVKNADDHYQELFHSDYAPATIQITSPNLDQVVTSDLEINWSVMPGSTEVDSIGIYISDYQREGWQKIGSLDPSAATFQYDIANLPSGINYQVAVKAYTQETSSVSTSDYFRIETSQTDAPEFLLLNPFNELVMQDAYELKYRAGQMLATPPELKMWISFDGAETYTELFSSLSLGQQELVFDSRQIPNSEDVRFAFSFNQNSEEEMAYVSNQFRIANTYPRVDETYIDHIRGPSDGRVRVDIYDPNLVTGDSYEVTFQDSFTLNLHYSVRNLDTDELLVDAEPVREVVEQSPSFDGLRLTIENVENTLIDSLSGWVNPLTNYDVIIREYSVNTRHRYPFDYEVVFYDHVVDTSVITNLELNCIVKQIGTEEQLSFYRSGHGNEGGFLSDDDRLITIREYPTGSSNYLGEWELVFNEPDSVESLAPAMGDTLRITSVKPFTYRDTLTFSTHDYVGIDPNIIHPDEFSLMQNFPNPFNASTQIRYTLKSNMHVRVEVFDITGRLIGTLAKTSQSAGSHTLNWSGLNDDGESMSSGVYICRMQVASGSGNYRLENSIKMILLK